MTVNAWPVRIFDEGKPNGGGSGLLIDRDLVLTCAHVVDEMNSPTVRFPARRTVGDVPAVAEISEQWRSGSGDRADVAVLRLARTVPVEPAKFAARNILDTKLHDLVAIGFPIAAGELGRIARVTATAARLLLHGEWVQLESETAFGPSIGKGYSGGAVALRSTLEVVGIITAADRAERLGLMLPLTKLVEYRQDLDDLLPLGPIAPDGHRALRALLTDISLTDPASVYRIAMEDPLLELPYSQVLPDRDRAYGLARYIAEGLFLSDPDGMKVRSALAQLCYEVAKEIDDAQLSKSLRDWVSRHIGGAVMRSTGPSSPTSTPFRVSVLVDHSGAGAQEMLLSVVIHPSGGLADYVFNERVSTNRIQSTVQDLLPIIINERIPLNKELTVEFILPRGWLSKPVDEWTLGRRSQVRVGWRHPVVVRDLARFRQNYNDRELGRRWAGLTGTIEGAEVVHWVRCRDAVSAGQMAASLAASAKLAMLALTYPPVRIESNPVMKAGFDSGVPVMLWRRIPCQNHKQGDQVISCDGDLFQHSISAELANFLARSSIGELPELIRQLRVAAGETQENESHFGRALTLLWDQPEQPTRSARLALAVRGE